MPLIFSERDINWSCKQSNFLCLQFSIRSFILLETWGGKQHNLMNATDNN